MNKASKKRLIGFLGIALGVVLLSGCTQNFCSNLDKANIAYAYDSGVTVYVDSADEIPDEYKTAGEGIGYWPVKIGGTDSGVLAYIPVAGKSIGVDYSPATRYTAKKAAFLNDNIISGALANGYSTPSFSYFKRMDEKVLDAAISEANKSFQDANHYNASNLTASMLNPFNKADCYGNEKDAEINKDSILLNYGYVKFSGPVEVEGKQPELWSQWNKWNDELEDELGSSYVPSDEFKTVYKQQIDAVINSQRSCISTQNGYFGHFGNSSSWSAPIEKKTWGYAWKKGFFEGLIVFPVSYLVDSIAYGIDPGLTGLGQVLSIVIVTIIVRAVILALTFKSTLDQQRTQAIQPQLAKIQAKYPNSNTNKDEAQRLQQEQMALYKRNKINPMSMLLTLIIQFPVFICVWGAMQGSAALASGSFLNLRLSDTISSVLMNFSSNWYANQTGWWTALVLFLMMAGFQILAMMLPRWMNDKKIKKLPKTTANPAQDKNGGNMKMMSWVMVIFTIIMGFALPAAMGLYWAVGALISMAQTFIMQYIMGKKAKK